MSKQYDNSNSGALFTTNVEGILSGPFTLGTEKKATHRGVMELGADGVHKFAVYKQGKDGQAVGKPKLKRVFKRTATAGAPNAAGNPTPAARSTDGEPNFVVWHAQNENGRFYQVKPDSFVQRELPPL